MNIIKLFKLNNRTVRSEDAPLLAGYPPRVRRAIFWYDSLSDRQRIQYACVVILFLLACGGYLLGLGSTIVLARVESEQAAFAAQQLPTEEATPTDVPATPTAAPPTLTPLPSSTPVPPTPLPSATPFTAPVIAEPPAAPRIIPDAPAPVVVAPAVSRATATVAKPRNVETSKPEAPAGAVPTATPGTGVRGEGSGVVPTAVRKEPTAAATVAGRAATPLTTLDAPTTTTPARGAPTTVPTRASRATSAPTTASAPTPNSRTQGPQPTPNRTPPPR